VSPELFKFQITTVFLGFLGGSLIFLFEIKKK